MSHSRLGVAAGRALEQLGRGGHGLAVGGVRERIERILEVELGDVGEGARRLQRRVARFVQPVKAVREHRTARRGRPAELADRGRRPAKFADRHVWFGLPARLAALQHNDESMTSSTYKNRHWPTVTPLKITAFPAFSLQPVLQNALVAALQQSALAPGAFEKQQEADHRRRRTRRRSARSAWIIRSARNTCWIDQRPHALEHVGRRQHPGEHLQP